jgi:hypothetical protein
MFTLCCLLQIICDFDFELDEVQAWCHCESCLTKSSGCEFEAASLQILQEEGLPRFSSSLDPSHVGASGTGSAPYMLLDGYKVCKEFQLFYSDVQMLPMKGHPC